MQLRQLTQTLVLRVERSLHIGMRAHLANLVWLQGGRILNVLMGLGLAYVFANYLPKETFGTYKYVIAFAGLISGFALYDLGTAIVRAVARGHIGVVRAVFWPSVYWSLPGALISCAAAGYYFFQGNELLGSALIIVAFAHVASSSYGINKSVFLGLQEYRSGALIALPRTLAITIALALAALFVPHPLVLLAVYFLGNALANVAMYFIVLRHYVTENAGTAPEATKESLAYAKHMMPNTIFVQAANQFDQFLMWHLAGPAQLAAYGLALTPVRELQNTAGSVLTLAMPKFAQQSITEIRVHLARRVIQLFVPSLALALACMFAIPIVFPLLFPAYPEAILPSQILALALLFSPRTIIAAQFFAHVHKRAIYINNAAMYGSRILLLLVLMPTFGILGAAYAYVGSEAIATVSALVIARKHGTL